MAVLTLVTGGGLRAHAQKYYNLKQVTTLTHNKLYVFEQQGCVMINSLTNSALQTTTNYKTTGLTGSESYVWKLSTSNSKWRMKANGGDSYFYFDTSDSKLKLDDSGSSKYLWQFDFDYSNDGTVMMKINYGTTYYLALQSLGKLQYKLYNTDVYGNHTDSYPYYPITVYELVEAEGVTVSAAGLATYVSGSGLDYSDVEGLKAYRAQVNGSTVNFYRTTEVPAGEGVLLRATTELDEATTFYVTIKSVSAWTSDYNDFITGTGAAVQTEEGGNYNYILNQKGGVVGFYQANNQTVATNRAYLQTTGAASRMTMQYDDETTTTTNFNLKQQRIKTNFTNDTNLINNSNVVFDLQGRKIVHGQLSNGQIPKGFYIMNGKKVVVR
jgi:hypothetical protein